MAHYLDDRAVSERLDGLEPDWSPNLTTAAAILHARSHPRRGRAWLATPVALAAACLLIALVPQARAMAQAVWARWTISRLDVVRVNLSAVPLDPHVTMTTMGQPVATAADAAALAGYAPTLPPMNGAIGRPRLNVTGPVTIDQDVRVADLRNALRLAGAADVQVPDAWNGAHLRVQIGSMIGANYPGDAEILQVQPMAFDVPVGVALTDFANVIFRIAGLPVQDARALALAYAIQPAWLLDIGKDEPARVQDVSLANGRALLIEEFREDTRAVTRVTVLRNTPARLFAVSSPTRQTTMALAAALP